MELTMEPEGGSHTGEASVEAEVYVGMEDKETSEVVEQADRHGMTQSADGEALLTKMLLAPLQRRRGEVAREGNASHRQQEREAAAAKLTGLQEETYTWQLLQRLLADVLSEHAREEPMQDAVAVPAHRTWAASHRDALQGQLTQNHSLRRAVLLLGWLEEVYGDEASADATWRTQHVAGEYRRHTQGLLEGGAGVVCPRTARALVSSIEVDAPLREDAHVHHVDEVEERALYRAVLNLIRCGRVQNARELCESSQHVCSAALLQESVELLQHLPGVHEASKTGDLPDEVVQRCHLDNTDAQENTLRYSYFASILDMANNKRAPGGQYYNAAFASLAGKAGTMLSGFDEPSFRDRLWAETRGFIEHSVHALLYPLLKGHEHCDDEDARFVMDETRPKHESIAQFSQAAEEGAKGANAYERLQAALVGLLGDGVKAGSVALANVFQLLDSEVSAASPRLAAYVALQLWRCRSQVVDPQEDIHTQTQHCLDNVLIKYSRHLCSTYPDQPDLLLSVIPYLASKVEARSVELASQFCVVLGYLVEDPDQYRQKLLHRLEEVGVDVMGTHTAASQMLTHGAPEVMVAWGIVQKGGNTEIDAVRALTFIPAQSLEALRAFNAQCRTLVHAVLQADQRMEGAMQSPVKDFDVVDAALVERRERLATLQRLFDEVFAHLKRQFETQLHDEKAGSEGRAVLLLERMEAQHWRTYCDVQREMLAWREVSEAQPTLLHGGAVPTSGAHATAHSAHILKLQRQHEEWALHEWTARCAFKDAALLMLARKNAAWLVDSVSVHDGLSPDTRQTVAALMHQRQADLAHFRTRVVPAVTCALLEMMAVHSEHLDTTQMKEEHASCGDVIDSLVSDDVTERVSLVGAFADLSLAMRVAEYIARIETRSLRFEPELNDE